MPGNFALRSSTVLIPSLFLTQACLAQLATSPAPEAAPSPLSVNVGLVSLYKYRGQDQYVSDSGKTRAVRPALQGGLDYSFANGFYLGNWNSSVRLNKDARVEMDFYGGYRTSTGPVNWDFGLLRYQYPGDARLNTTEVYAAGSWEELTLKNSHTVSRRYFGLDGGRGTGYVNLAWSHPLGSGLGLQAALGHTFLPAQVRAGGLSDYSDYSLGLAWEFQPHLTLTAGIAGADRRTSWGDINRPRAIAGLKAVF